jgi:hypothetical protein
MPYGIDKKLGGDKPSNTKWMEKCVKRVMMGSNYSKGRAVAICKTILKKRKEKK